MAKGFKLFALGSNGCGQLGIGHKEDTAIPQLCKFEEEDIESIARDDRIVKIAAGGNHTLLLLRSGAVFAAGSNEVGQCCLPASTEARGVFRRVDVHEGIQYNNKTKSSGFVDISATWEASFLLNRGGQVFAFGQGLKGELGGGKNVTTTGKSSVALSLDFDRSDSPISKLQSSMRHTIAISKDGTVYGWGVCRKGELGATLESKNEIWSPAKLSVPFQCQNAALGRNFSILVGTDTCTIFDQDQALDGLTELENLPDAIEAGWSTAFALIKGRVTAFGRNDRGQWPSTDLADLSKVAAGSEHCIALTSTGQPVAWGWGEHGNCGQPTDTRGNVEGRWNDLIVPLDEDEAIIDVAAGCATSFIIVGGGRP